MNDIFAPCPFCGSNKVSIEKIEEYYEDYAVTCECTARGAWDNSKESAVSHWDERINPSDPSAELLSKSDKMYIKEAYIFLREHNHTIPGEILEYMKYKSLGKI